MLVLRLCRALQRARSLLEGTLLVLQTKALQPLLSRVRIPAPAPQALSLCCFLRGAVSVRAAGSRLSWLPRHRAACPGEGDGGVPPCHCRPRWRCLGLGAAGCPSGLAGSRLGLSGAFAPLGCRFPGPPVLPPAPTESRSCISETAFIENKETRGKAP